MKEDDRWSVIWLLWALYFGVAEYVALKSGNSKAPLSYHLRRALGIRKQPWQQRAGQVALGAGTVWLINHLYREASND